MKTILLFLFLSFSAHAGNLQNVDFATSAQITGAGGSVTQLLNSSKMYDTVNAQIMNTSIATWNAKQAALSTSSAPANQFCTGFTAPNTFTYAQPAFSNISGLVTNAQLTNASTTVNGQTCTLGSTCTVTDAGAVTAVSVASANGFAGSSSGGTTPALTLSTTITGVLKGNGTAISAATSGTDYAPATSGSAILKGNGAGGFSSATAGTDYQDPISTSAAVANQFITAFTAPNTFSRAQPAFTDISGAATGAQLPAPALSTISASDVDWSVLKNTDGAYTKTLSANTTLTFSNIVAGQTIVIFLTNTASNFTVTWPSSAHFPSGTAPVQTVGAKLDVITCKAVSTSVAYCQSVQNFTP
jgi:hypothetical protein